MLHKKAVGYDDIAIDLLTGREDDLCGILFELFLQVFLPAFIMELVTAHKLIKILLVIKLTKTRVTTIFVVVSSR